MNKIIDSYTKVTGIKSPRKTIFLEIKCNICGNTYHTAKSDHARAVHPFMCKSCSKAMKRHRGTDGNPLPQTKEKKLIQSSWDKMIERTTNPKHHAYKNYGGKGIKIEFKSFGEFYEWSMQNGYKQGLTIDRFDNNDNYRPDNCKWSTRLEQAQNRTTGKTNMNGYAGVRERGGKFLSRVTYDGKEYYCGTYDTPEEAHEAHLAKKKELLTTI